MSVEVEALRMVEHGGTHPRGDRWIVSDRTARDLERKGLVAITGDPLPETQTADDQKISPTAENPTAAGGAKSSASPAAQASQKQTVKKSGSGATRKKAAESS